MSILGRKISAKAVAALAAVMIVGALLPVLTDTPSREITLVARGMAFYADGDFDHANPTLEVRAGERVRIVVRNEERGLMHDFTLPAANVATNLLKWNEEDAVTFNVPDAPGTYDYAAGRTCL
jgi:uncharacterized cupredoxin-like copper-binding protein